MKMMIMMMMMMISDADDDNDNDNDEDDGDDDDDSEEYKTVCVWGVFVLQLLVKFHRDEADLNGFAFIRTRLLRDCSSYPVLHKCRP